MREPVSVQLETDPEQNTIQVVRVGERALSPRLSRVLIDANMTDEKTVKFVDDRLQSGKNSEEELGALALVARESQKALPSIVKFTERHQHTPAETGIVLRDASALGTHAHVLSRGAKHVHSAAAAQEWADAPPESRLDAISTAIDLMGHWREVNELYGSVSYQLYLKLYDRLRSPDAVQEVIEKICDDLGDKSLGRAVSKYLRDLESGKAQPRAPGEDEITAQLLAPNSD